MAATSKPSCTVLRATETYAGKQGLAYAAGISAESVGAKALCLTTLTLPPGARAKAHLHESHETAIYVVSGEAEMLFGEGLREHATYRAGDYIYIPAGVPHLPYNAGSEPCVAVIARTDPNEQESVVLLPELDSVNRDP